MLSSFFDAKSIAVVGVSRDPHKVGHQIFNNLLSTKSTQLFPVNPEAHSILSHRAYASLLDIPNEVDVVIIAVPVPVVESIVNECIEKKVKAVIIITAGFAETSPQGKSLQDSLAQKLVSHHIELLGPNSLGLISPHLSLNASFAQHTILPGSLALISQSGAMLTALFTQMATSEVGCSFAVSLGNKAGISENDALEFALSDPHTKTIGLYLESFADLPQFFSLCSKISKQKPIILLKGGRTKTGHSASVSHTAALATNDILLQAASEQFGFVMVESVEQFIQTLFFLEKQKSLPENTLIITNAGGPGVNTADLAEMYQLPLAKWSAKSEEHIADHFPQLHVANPLDVLGDAGADRFAFTIHQAQADPNIDSISVIVTQQAVTNMAQVVHTLLEQKGKKSLSVALIGGDHFNHYRTQLKKAGIFATDYPNEIIEILSIVKKAARAKYISNPSHFSHLKKEDHSFSKTPTFSSSIDQTFQLLKTYHFTIPHYVVATSEEQLSRVVLPAYAKTANLSLMHKKDLGALYGIVEKKSQLKDSFNALQLFGNAVLYQEVLPTDLEILLGATRDPQFGLFMAVGLGGSWTNVLSDRSYSFLPTFENSLRQQLMRTKAFEAIKKLEQEYDRDITVEIVGCMQHLQQLMIDHPEIKELEINPLMVNKKGVCVADVKVKE